MPRKARARPTASGGAYANRTDLQVPNQPVKVATGQPYGEAKKMADAQAAVPLPDNAGALDSLLATATATPPPVGGLGRMTDAPTEPVTAGLPIGPGPGPEAVQIGRPQRASVGDTLRLLASATGDPMFEQLAAEAG